MSMCDQRQDYLDRTLSPEQSAAWVRHAHGCAACTRAMQAWAETEAAVQDWAQARQARPRTRGDAEALMARAQAQARRRLAVPPWALAVAAVLLGVALLWPDRSPLSTEPPTGVVAQVGIPETAGPEVLHQQGEGIRVGDGVLEVPDAGRLLVSVGEDQLGLGAGTRLHRQADADPWTLQAGTAAFSIAPRAPGEQFRVAVDDWEVVVVGTRFRVDRTDGLAVSVGEGTVEVRGPERTWRVRAGQRYHQGQVSDHDDPDLGPLLAVGVVVPEVPALAPKTVSAAERRAASARSLDLDALRRRLIGGEVAPVRDLLADHVARQPSDMEAWKLLALAERKAGDTAAATAAWLRVGEHATGTAQSRAWYEAALLLQEQGLHGDAVGRFYAFLGSTRRSNSLEAAARLHLSRSLIALDRTEAATAELERIIDGHQGTSAATQARQLLKEIKY